MLRKCFSIFLSILILIDLVGYYPFFKIEQWRIKREIKHEILNKLPENELIKFSFTKDQYKRINWKDNGQEFTYQGRMYDIVRKTLKKGSYTLVCINDVKEEKFFDKLNDIAKKQLETSDNFNVNLSLGFLKHFLNLPFLGQPTRHLLFSINSLHIHADYLLRLISVSQEILCPPPQVII